MKMLSWLKKTKNDHEASSSRSMHRGRRPPSPPPWALQRQLPPAPRSEDYVTGPTHIVVAHPRPEHEQRYVPKKKCEAL
jgi:hypothetical protein